MQEREAAAGTAADKEGVISSPHDSSRDGSPQDETGGDMGRQHDASTPNADPERNRLFHAALRKRLSKQHYDTWFRRTHVRHWGTGSMSLLFQ